MKRNLIIKKITALVMTVLMLSSCWVWMPIEAEAATEEKTFGIQFPRKEELSGGDAAWKAGFGTLKGTLVNGTEFKTDVSFNGLHAVGSYSNISYCIEPGVPISEDENKNKISASTTPDKDLETLAERARKATGIEMTGQQMKFLLGCILGYGYEHDKSIIYSWDNLIKKIDDKYYSSGSNDAKRFSEAYATQLLVWELVVGERTSTFDLVPIDQSKYITSTGHALRTENPLYSSIMEYYYKIEEDVKNAARYSDSGIESKTYTMQTNDALKTMEITIPDNSGLYQGVNSIPGINGASISHVNNELKISIPYRYAKEGTYKIEFKKKVKVVDDINFYISGDTQSMITANATPKEIEKDGSLTIIIPHHHEWIPHYVIPTCTTEGLTCMMCKCGDIYTQKVEPCLGHNANSPWVIGYPATCTEDGEMVQICDRCNTVINTKPINATGHDAGVWVIEVEATADHKGQMVRHCTKCGNRTETTEFSPHTHTGKHTAIVNTATCANEGTLGTFCDICGVCYKTSVIPSGHSKDLTWITTLQPTCTGAGESSAFCNDCGDIVATKALESTGHSDGIWTTSIAPYCGLAGEEICICDKCGETIASRETEALSHDEGVWKTTQDPTCELDGEKVKSCTRCGQVVETQSIEAIGHDNGVWKIDIEATADIGGSMSRYCTRCSMVLETKTFTLHSHEEGYKVTILQNTCTRDGEKGTVCKICNAVYSTETIPALNHDYSDFYTEDNGTHSKSCSRCHYVYTENCAYEIIESYEATCTTAGYKTSKCTVCDYTYSDSYVAPYGHTLGKWTTEGKSTHMRYCSECGVMEITKHVWGEYFSNNDGDIIEEGSKTRSCIYCGESQTIGKPASIIESTYKATITILDFLINLISTLAIMRDLLIAFIEISKS